MNRSVLIATILIVIGIFALGYEGISYITHEEVLDIGPLELDVEKKETLPLPPIVGVICLGAGIFMLVNSKGS